jgi:uncharacterized protein involved in type VI secretion and phage assembly
LLTFETKPKCIQGYSVAGFQVEQALGEIGTLSIRLYPTKASKDPELSTYAAVQEVLGEKLTCKSDEWTFVGSVEQLEYSTENGLYQIVLKDSLAKLDGIFCSQVFADESLGDIIARLIPSGLAYECLAGCDSYQVKLAIQYQESNLNFLKRIVNEFGGQIWCVADTIFIGTGPSRETQTLRLGRDITDYSIRTQLGPESVEMGSISYVEGSSQASGVELKGGDFGTVQNSAMDLRKKHEGQKAFHIIQEDSSYEDTTHFANRFLRSQASGRFVIGGLLHKPIPLGSKIKVESYDRESGSSKVIESALVTALRAASDYTADTTFWQVEASNPDAVLYGEKPASNRLFTSTAIVSDANDPLALNRLRVFFPWDRNECETPWLRMASASWGQDHYQFIPPKAGDTVLVVWGQYDMDPVVLGCLSGGDDVEQSSESAVLRTVDGHLVTIGDKNIKLLNEAGGGGSSVEIQPDKIIVTSKEGQTVTIGKQAIKIDTGKGTEVELKQNEIKLTSSGKIVLNGPTGIELKTPKLDVG